MTIQKLKFLVNVFVIFYMILFYVLLLILPKNYLYIASNVMSPIGIVFSLFVIAYSIKKHECSYQKRYWMMFFIGNLFFLLGDLVWGYYELIVKQDVIFPSIADVFYMIAPICYLMAMFFIFHFNSFFLNLRTILDILIIFIVSAAIEWKFIVLPQYHDTHLDLLGKIATVWYPVADLALLFTALLLYFSQNLTHVWRRWFFLAPLFFIIADQVYLMENVYDTYYIGQLIDPLWVFGILIIAMASIKSAQENIETTSLAFSKKMFPIKSCVRTTLTYSLAGILIILMFVYYIELDPIYIGAFGTIILLFSRQIITLLENQRLMNLLLDTNTKLQNNQLMLQKTIKELNKANEFIKMEARTDFLTRLYNRRYMEEVLNTIEQQALKDPISFCVLLLDIDHFKQVNDQYGHEAGDLVLQQFAKIVKENIREEDVAGRWGGEEFLIILKNNNPLWMKEVAERLRQKVEKCQFSIGNQDIHITVSIGCTHWLQQKKDSVSSLITRVDESLYHAKKNGRNCVIIK